MIAVVTLLEPCAGAGAEISRAWQCAQRENARAARALDRLGMPVLVERETGAEMHGGRLIARPYQIANGGWFCRVEGITEAVDCVLVHPARETAEVLA